MIKWALKTVKNKVFLSELSKMEYGNEGVVISNPITITSNEIANLQSKRVICVARHSHEKGIDRLLHIWKEINAIHPEWILDIYGDGILYDTNVALANQLNIASSINFYLPITNIDEKYLEASLCLMTSRYEGLPLVLIEALHFGLPIVAYDCPDGPRVIIENETNGFLVPNGNQRDFIRQTIKLMDDFELRTTIGKAAKLSAKKYDREAIMEKWDTYFKTLV
jgi:glycosyltransferase involved in cell wall biosynthesis